VKRFLEFARNLYRRVHNWVVPPYATRIVEEALPKKLRRRTIYVVQEDGFQEGGNALPLRVWLGFAMNLLRDERPCWNVIYHENGTVTLHPSVWRKKDCGSHFWFRRGRVDWCRAVRRNVMQDGQSADTGILP
jgi:hypothetical protein